MLAAAVRGWVGGKGGDDASSSPNDLYDAAQTYLGSYCLASAPVIPLYKPHNSAHPVPSLPPSHTACDFFNGIPLRWTSHAVETPSSSSPHRSLELSFHRRHRNAVHSQYIPYVIDEAARLRLKARERRLYANCSAAQGDDHHRLWSSVPFAHPATFDTLAIDPALRDDIRDDLLRFRAPILATVVLCILPQLVTFPAGHLDPPPERREKGAGMAVVWHWESIRPVLAFFKKQIAPILVTVVLWILRQLGTLRGWTLASFNKQIASFLEITVLSILRQLATFLRSTATIIIAEHDASSSPNDLYDAAQTYLGSYCLASAPVITLYKPHNSAHPVPSLPPSHTACDFFNGIPLRWTSHAVETPSSSSPHRSLELSFHRRHRNAVHSQYIPYVIDEAARLRLKARERRLYANCSAAQGDDHHRLWSSVPFAHPATFDTLAIDPALRDDIRDDLLRFVGRRDHYSRVGLAWRRAYLLHGPPGTGKTSLVAAIANLLEFDVYNLQLTTVPSDSPLRRLLVSTTPKSVVAKIYFEST
ncbi:hypothetical protein COCNU_scaffold033853G000030 [Cocos nucifera]|nr:hypothetical protein [Cocos nucifera]